MGNSTWSSDAYQTYQKSYKTQSTDQIFSGNRSKRINETHDPNGLTFRESRDSLAHPNTLGVSIWLDITGSMGDIPNDLIRNKLGKLMETFAAHNLPDAQVLFGAIGDHFTDRAKLQIGQYESGTDELNNGLSKLWLEGNGGGQKRESYLLAWLVAARHTSLDCFEKRNQKGILFTIGDEATHPSLSVEHVKEIMGYDVPNELTAEALLAEAEKSHHIFHIHIEQGSYRSTGEYGQRIVDSWKKLIGERLIILDEYANLAELIASTVAMIHGIDLEEAVASFDEKTKTSVRSALQNVDMPSNLPNANVISF